MSETNIYINVNDESTPKVNSFKKTSEKQTPVQNAVSNDIDINVPNWLHVIENLQKKADSGDLISKARLNLIIISVFYVVLSAVFIAFGIDTSILSLGVVLIMVFGSVFYIKKIYDKRKVLK